MNGTTTYRVGVDIGGTFTDLLVTDGSGKGRVYKSPTTPSDPTVGFFAALQRAARDDGMELDDFLARVATIVHGTTITTNAVLTGEGAVTGFVTTKGFRDVLQHAARPEGAPVREVRAAGAADPAPPDRGGRRTDHGRRRGRRLR